jgi:hypothetical protein
MNWINLAQDMDPWSILMNAVINFRDRKRRDFL